MFVKIIKAAGDRSPGQVVEVGRSTGARLIAQKIAKEVRPDEIRVKQRKVKAAAE